MNAVLVVLEEEASDVDEVHDVGLGKGEGLAGEPSHTLSKREVETFETIGRPLFLLLVELLLGHHKSVSGPGIGKSTAAFVAWGHLVPELLAGASRVVAWHPCHHLPCSAAQGHMNPYLVFLTAHIRP